MTKSVNWFTMDDDFNSLGFLDTELTFEGDYICPKCGNPAQYWEGTVDQDRMGNDIQGYSYDCYDCKITTGTDSL